MEAKQLIQKAKDKAALELGWIDWVCFRADSDYLDQDIVIDRAMEIYARSPSTPPANTVTGAENIKAKEKLDEVLELLTKLRVSLISIDDLEEEASEINMLICEAYDLLSAPPANTITYEEIEKEIDKGLARSDYPSYEKDSGYRSGFQACVKWSRDRLSQTPEKKDEDEEKRKCIECEIEIENEIWCDMHTPLINPT